MSPKVSDNLRSMGEFWDDFGDRITNSPISRTALFRGALESYDPGANHGSKVRIRALEVDFITFEMARLPNNRIFWSIFLPIRNPITRQSGYLKFNEIDAKCSDFKI